MFDLAHFVHEAEILIRHEAYLSDLRGMSLNEVHADPRFGPGPRPLPDSPLPHPTQSALEKFRQDRESKRQEHETRLDEQRALRERQANWVDETDRMKAEVETLRKPIIEQLGQLLLDLVGEQVIVRQHAT